MITIGCYEGDYHIIKNRSQNFGMWNWTISLTFTSRLYLIALAIVKHLGDICTAGYFQTLLDDVSRVYDL